MGKHNAGNSPGTSQPVEETASITTPASETSTLEGEKAAEATPSVQPESSEKQAEEKKRIEETVEQPAATADKEGKMRKTLKTISSTAASQNQPTKPNKESTASIENQKKKSRTFQNRYTYTVSNSTNQSFGSCSPCNQCSCFRWSEKLIGAKILVLLLVRTI